MRNENLKKKILLGFLISAVLVLTGCGSSSSNLSGLVPPPTDGRVTIPEQPHIPRFETTNPGSGVATDFATGSTADLIPVSLSNLDNYALRSHTNPTNIKVNVSLDDFGSGSMGGMVTVSYDDAGQHIEATFNAGAHHQDAQYNRWFRHNGKDVFHGFFEDEYGAIILVIDDVLNLGDGGGSADTVNGSIWFKNHRITQFTGPNPSTSCVLGFGCPSTRCWFVKAGPYECRAFVVGDEISTTSSLYPGNGYQKLGDFTGLSRHAAFAGN